MYKMRLRFEKGGTAIYLSHLDVMRTFQRAFQRAEIVLRHTEGFNPHPYLSIAHPLPVGYGGKNEVLDSEFLSDSGTDWVARLNASLPDGLRVRQSYGTGAPVRDIAFANYRIRMEYDRTLPEGTERRLLELFSRGELPVEKKTKRGISTINIREHIGGIDCSLLSGDTIRLGVSIVVGEAPINPRYLIAAINEEDLRPVFVECVREGFSLKNGADFV